MAYSFQGVHFSMNQELITDHQMILKRSPISTQYSNETELNAINFAKEPIEIYGFKFRPYGEVSSNEFIYTYTAKRVNNQLLGMMQLVVRNHTTEDIVMTHEEESTHPHRLASVEDFIELLPHVSSNAYNSTPDDEMSYALRTILHMNGKKVWGELMNRVEKTDVPITELQFLGYNENLAWALSESVTNVSYNPDNALKRLALELDGVVFSIQELTPYVVEIHVDGELITRQIYKECRSWNAFTLFNLIFNDSFRDLLEASSAGVPHVYKIIMWNNFAPLIALPAQRKEPW